MTKSLCLNPDENPKSGNLPEECPDKNRQDRSDLLWPSAFLCALKPHHTILVSRYPQDRSEIIMKTDPIGSEDLKYFNKLEF